MSIKLLREASIETKHLLDRHDPRKLPVSGKFAYGHLKRLPNIAKAIEVLVAAELPAEAIGARRPLIDSLLKCGYVLQGKSEGGSMVDRDEVSRDEAALELLNAEQAEDAKMVELAAVHAPGAFDAMLLATAAETRKRLAALERPKHTSRLAELSGLEAEYRLGFGPTSAFCHGSVRIALISTNPQPKKAIATSLEHSAAAALRLLNVGAQLLHDEQARARSIALGAKLQDRD
jgi:hypothetical protein